jgi:DNA modification methylase
MLKKNISYLVDAANDNKVAKGYTHNFYNYPARFSPLFVREVIETFTHPGDLIIDPFVGGGTTLVESRLSDRNSIGLDISSLATFVTNSKINPPRASEIAVLNEWISEAVGRLNCRSPFNRPLDWINEGYQKNISDKSAWPIRKLLELFVGEIESGGFSTRVENFLRCLALKTGQWALDNRKDLPSSDEFRRKLLDNFSIMSSGSLEFLEKTKISKKGTITRCFNKSSYEIDKLKLLSKLPKPKLILTSPPYPGIHVVYHRWQVQGKKETPAPFWIANSLDGHGLSFYTLGSRQQKKLNSYYEGIRNSFSSIRNICSSNTIIVQVLAFSDISWQLPKYLEVMASAGFEEVHFTNERIWRDVPNRKWYADQKGKTNSSNEVVLFHKLVR